MLASNLFANLRPASSFVEESERGMPLKEEIVQLILMIMREPTECLQASARSNAKRSKL